MLFTKPTLLLLSSISLVFSWDIHSVSDVTPIDHRNSGRGTSDCINRNHKRDGRLRFSREGSSCCLHIYKEVDCNLDQLRESKMSICRDYKDDIDFHFRSYYVDCDGRGVNNPTLPSGSYSSSQQPYGYSGQAPYGSSPQPYNNGPPPPYSYSPQPYNSGPPPYNNPPAPYSPCRVGDRCYAKEETEGAKGSEST